MYDYIVAPELWWPNGMGEPHLYKYKAVLSDENLQLDSAFVSTGLRSIELVQHPDSVGKSFYFEVNGVPVFVKGANYIPSDNFLPRVSDEKYNQIVEDAKNANMNMLRVWGGGTYEKEIFYRLCDENGIMVWQDFMFAGDMYPGDSLFIENVKQEAVENVTRLRNHSSIVLWCGNNEIDEAWHNWGWQKQYNYSKEDSSKLWKAYLKIFENILPEVVRHKSPGTFYWPSSPSVGWGNQEAYRQGDVHYWEVWWGRAPFVNYEKKIGRFMSEYGFQGLPEMKTIDSFTLPEDRRLGSAVMNVHQKHPFGWEAIGEYMERDYPVPKNPEYYL
jgi:beta-mannosidase